MLRRKRAVGAVLAWVGMAIAGIWIVLPFYWAIITSLKLPADVFKLSVVPFLQFEPTLAHWRSEVVLRRNELVTGLSNSFIVSLSTALIGLAIGTLAGYALARFRYRRWKNKDITLWILSQRFLPPAATVVPFFLVFQRLGLLDTQLALILVNTTFTIPFAALILRDAFKELPMELEEAAQVDGCSPFQTFVRVALPLVAPALVSAGIIIFAFAWNEFLFAFVLTYSRATPMTVVISGTSDTTGIQFWYVSTRMLMAILPPALLTLAAQRYIVRGLTFGAVKG